MQIEEGLAAYARQLSADGRSEHTIQQARRHVTLLVHWAARVGMSGDVLDLGHEDVARFLTSSDATKRPDGQPKKATSVNALRSSLKTYLGYLHAAGHTSSDPGRLIRRAITGDPPPRAMSESDQRKLVDALSKAKTAAEKRDQLLFSLMLGTGLRLGSALALRWEDVDVEAREIRVRCMKGNREDVVFVPEVVVSAFDTASLETGGWMFPGAEGQLSPRHVQRRLSMWLQKAGIEKHFTPHSLRHSFATRLYRETSDLRLVQRALNHRSIASTACYARPSSDALRGAIAAVSLGVENYLS